MRGPIPTVQCDAEDGSCGSWDIDYYALDSSSVDGAPVTSEHRAPGWVSTENSDLCPEHANKTPDEDKA